MTWAVPSHPPAGSAHTLLQLYSSPS